MSWLWEEVILCCWPCAQTSWHVQDDLNIYASFDCLGRCHLLLRVGTMGPSQVPLRYQPTLPRYRISFSYLWIFFLLIMEACSSIISKANNTMYFLDAWSSSLFSCLIPLPILKSRQAFLRPSYSPAGPKSSWLVISIGSIPSKVSKGPDQANMSLKISVPNQYQAIPCWREL